MLSIVKGAIATAGSAPVGAAGPVLYLPGRYISAFETVPVSTTNNTLIASPNVLYLFPFEVRRDISITAIAAWSTVVNASQVKLLLYRSSATTGLPTTNVVTTPALTGAADAREHTFAALALTAGLYWVGLISIDNATLRAQGPSDHGRRHAFGVSTLADPTAPAWPVGFRYTSQAFATPAPDLTGVAASADQPGSVPVIWLKVA